MKLCFVKIYNYRNLDNLSFTFNDELNFIIGENNLGKSNFIDLLQGLFDLTRFSEDDFFDLNIPIRVEMELKLSAKERPIFATRDKILFIKAIQKNADANIVYFNAKTNTEISVEAIRCVNFFRDGAIAGQGLDFRFLKLEHFGRIYKYYKSRYGSFENLELSKKFLLAIELLILEKISIVNKTRKEKIKDAFDKKARVNKRKTEKPFSFPIMLAFDELEMHLHPYIQRSIVRALSKIINNENSFFCEILKKEFGIKNFSGQIFIVTHSPNILLNDYKQFIRFYKNTGQSAVVCGENINVQNDKHLFKNFIYFKEAFFAKFVIVVEGDSEFVAIPEFAEKILGGNNFDTFGVSIIKADGKTSVSLVMKILQAFKINNLGVVDRDDDDYSIIQSRLNRRPHLYTTYFRDFEEELLEKLGFENYHLLDKFLFLSENEKSTFFARTIRDEQYCKKLAEKYSLKINFEQLVCKDYLLQNYFKSQEVIKLFYLSELNRRKGISFWHELAYELPQKFIPDIYRTIILEAVSIE